MRRTMKKAALGALAFVFAAAMALPGAPMPAFAAGQSTSIVAGDVAVGAGESLPSNGKATALEVQANSKRDILLGVFTRGLNKWTNDVYASYNGKTFYNIASTFKSWSGESYYEGHYAQQCPSIIYHDGYFWSLSSWNRGDGKFWPLISYSKDLVHWTHPEGDAMLRGTHGIALDRLPTVDGGGMFAFDVVAPEWSKTANGDIYIVFSAGYYGEYHGEPTHDKMQAYTVKVKRLSAAVGERDGSSGYLWPQNLVFKAGVAKKVGFTDYNNADFIDGQIFADKGKNYLIIKKNSLTNQLYVTKNIKNPNKWRLVNPDMTFGYEGASLAKLKGKYLLFTDGVLDTKPLGVRLASSRKLTKAGSWGEPGRVLYLSGKFDKNMKTRHGTVITLKAGTKGWKVAKKLLNKQRRLASGSAYRLYNSRSGEYFYTASAAEAGKAVHFGWKYRGVGWRVAAKSRKPVYRLFDGVDHLFTADKKERSRLLKRGWKSEGIAWYSDKHKGVPVYRLYNPRVNPHARRNYAGSHYYTVSVEERDRLVAQGWRAEGIGWYAVAG